MRKIKLLCRAFAWVVWVANSVAFAQNTGGNGGGEALLFKLRLDRMVFWVEQAYTNQTLSKKLELEGIPVSPERVIETLLTAKEKIGNSIKIDSSQGDGCRIDYSATPRVSCGLDYWVKLSEPQKYYQVALLAFQLEGLAAKFAARAIEINRSKENGKSTGAGSDKDLCSAIVYLEANDDTSRMKTIERKLNEKGILSTKDSRFFTHRLWFKTGYEGSFNHAEIEIRNEADEVVFKNASRDPFFVIFQKSKDKLLASMLDLISSCKQNEKNGWSDAEIRRENLLFQLRADRVITWLERLSNQKKLEDRLKISQVNLSASEFMIRFRAAFELVKNAVQIDGEKTLITLPQGQAGERICTNSSSSGLIHCSIGPWIHLPESVKYYLVFHEILGVANIETDSVGFSRDLISSAVFGHIDEINRVATVPNHLCDGVVFIDGSTNLEAAETVKKELEKKNISVTTVDDLASHRLSFKVTGEGDLRALTSAELSIVSKQGVVVFGPAKRHTDLPDVKASGKSLLQKLLKRLPSCSKRIND